MHRDTFPAPRLSITPTRLLADGYDIATLTIEGRSPAAPRISVVEHPHAAAIEEVAGGDGRWEAQVRAGIVPGLVRLRVGFPGSPAAFIQFETLLDSRDGMEDGTPDFLRLTDERDRQAFRRWFTWLAEAQYFQAPAARPAEIDDCAALIRYAYREALHAHDSGWMAAAHLPMAPALESVSKYRYPYTPLGAALFRVRPGGFRASDLSDGAFAQFADAQTLWRLNCHFVSREVSAARPGDLFFFRQEEGAERFHSMIYLGDSQIRKDGRRYVVYHTGAGEIRRLTMEQLAEFPQSEWRPLAANPGFLGVYRWNILCSGGTN
jgi:uncharacterized protein YfaT (DUF1175 family)